jgi:fatty acid CoA ligase FadD9
MTDQSGAQPARLAERIEQLNADDEQFRNAQPDAAVRHAARLPGLRLPQVMETLVQGYADRPALGWRARSLTSDPASGRITAQLLPSFRHHHLPRPVGQRAGDRDRDRVAA